MRQFGNRNSYTRTPQDRRGPAPMASFEDLSLASFEISPDDPKEMSGSGIMEDNNRRIAGNYQRLLGKLEDNGSGERALLQSHRDQSVTFGYREGYPGQDILQATEGLDERVRQVYVRRNSGRDSYSTSGTVESSGIEYSRPYHQYNFRMIDASQTDLRDPIDRTRRYSNSSSIGGPDPYHPGARMRVGSTSSESTIRSGRGSPSGRGKVAIETSFCGPKPIPSQSFEMVQPPASNLPGHDSVCDSPVDSEDGRNLIEEINRRMQFPLTKQDSYANAIYSGAGRKGMRKQGSYEAAVESGLKAQAAIKMNKQILKMKKQDSYARAIGDSFEEVKEDEILSTSSAGRSPMKMKKQESYLKAVGEMSPEMEDFGPISFSTSPSRHYIRKQDSYTRAMSNEDELTPLPSKSRSLTKQDSYQRAMQGDSLSFSDSFENSSSSNSEGKQPRRIRKQDSYNKAITDSSCYEEVVIEPVRPGESEQHAAVAIQSAFKGYRTRKDIQQIQAFYQKGPELAEDSSCTRPSYNEPLTAKKRQDSYLQAINTSPRDELPPTTRSWKRRQDSYQQAMDLSPPGPRDENVSSGGTNARMTMAKRQDSYLHAIGIGASDSQVFESVTDRKKSWSTRQDSYQRAQDLPVGSDEDGDVTPVNEEDKYIVGQRRIQRVDTDSISSSSGDVLLNHRSNSFQMRGGYDALTSVLTGGEPRGIRTHPSNEPAIPRREESENNHNDIEDEELPDLTSKEVAKAAIKIQSVYRGFQVRKSVGFSTEAVLAALKIQRNYKKFKAKKREKEELNHAAVKIQSRYRGFQTRKSQLSAFEVAKAAITIQSAYRKFKAKRMKEDLPDLEDEKVQEATVKIQSAFRGFKTRKEAMSTFEVVQATMKIQKCFRRFKAKQKHEEETAAALKIQSHFRGLQVRRDTNGQGQNTAAAAEDDDLPDLNDANTAVAALKIQSVYRGFKSRKEYKSTMEVVNATIKIQKAYKGFKVRKETKKMEGTAAQDGKKVATDNDDEMPDLNLPETKEAALKIQSVFRGFQTRKQLNSTAEAARAAMRIQSLFRGFKVRKEMNQKKKLTSTDKQEEEDLPDLKAHDVQDATLKLQSAFRGFQARRKIKSTREAAEAAIRIQTMYRGFKTRKALKEEQDLPDLKDEGVQNAAVKIQAVFRGFQTRKSAAEVVDATMKIQAGYRKFKENKEASKKAEEADEDLPDLKCPQVADATLKIQSAFRGFQARKEAKSTREVVDATIRIQSAFRGAKTRKSLKEKSEEDDMPDLTLPETKVAAVKIQSVYRGFQTRKQMRSAFEVASAATKIQRAFRKFKAKKPPSKALIPGGKAGHQVTKGIGVLPKKETMPFAAVDERVGRKKPLRFPKKELTTETLKEDRSGELLRHPGDVVAAAITIQRFFRMLKERNRRKRKLLKRKGRPRQRRTSSSSTESRTSTPSSDSSSTESDSSSEESKSGSGSSSASSRSSSSSGSESAGDKDGIESSDYETDDESLDKKKKKDSNDGESTAAGFLQKKLKFFSRGNNEQQQSSSKTTEDDKSRNNISKEDVARALDITAVESNKIKSAKLPPTPAPSIDFDNIAPVLEEKSVSSSFGVQKAVKSPLPARSSKLKEVPIPKVPPPSDATQSALGLIRQSSLGNFFKRQDGAQDEGPASLPAAVESSNSQKTSSSMADVISQASVVMKLGGTSSKAEDKEDKKKGGFFSTFLRRGDKKKKEEQPAMDHNSQPPQQAGGAKTQVAQNVEKLGAKPKLQSVPLDGSKEDLIHVVLNAVEENWLNQAPHPTLDKSKALMQHDDDFSESEKDLSSEQNNFTKVNKASNLDEDEAAVVLFGTDNESNDLPYLETTLPQERPGIVTITPSHQRVSDCKLASINRPRSSSPKNPARLKDFEAPIRISTASEKIKVKLPKQDSISKPKPKPESWDNFSSKGLKSFKAPEDEAVCSKPIAAVPPKRKEWIEFDNKQQQQQSDSRSRSKSPVPPPVPVRTEASLTKEKEHKRSR